MRCLTPARDLACRACRRGPVLCALTVVQPAGSAGSNEEYEGRSTERRAAASHAGVSTAADGAPG